MCETGLIAFVAFVKNERLSGRIENQNLGIQRVGYSKALLRKWAYI